MSSVNKTTKAKILIPQGAIVTWRLFLTHSNCFVSLTHSNCFLYQSHFANRIDKTLKLLGIQFQPLKNNIIIMDTFTNPIGDPTDTDFFKETLVEKILTEVENEVYWKLLRLPRDETPLLIDVYDTKTGFRKGFRHAPYCRCVFCPFNDLNYAKNLHKRKLSPFNDWNLDPTGNTYHQLWSKM